MDQPEIVLELTRSEAVVFVDFPMRFHDHDRLAIEHEAESCLLYDLCSMVEDRLPELFDPAWRILVDRSRDEVIVGPG